MNGQLEHIRDYVDIAIECFDYEGGPRWRWMELKGMIERMIADNSLSPSRPVTPLEGARPVTQDTVTPSDCGGGPGDIQQPREERE